MTNARPTRDRGSGVFGTTFGLFIFLLMMLVAVHTMYALYARSMLTNAAHDAARHVAGYASAASRDTARATEDQRFREHTGLDNAHARLEWAPDDGEVVTVRVVARPPSMIPHALSDLLGVGMTDRTVHTRVERER